MHRPLPVRHVDVRFDLRIEVQALHIRSHADDFCPVRDLRHAVRLGDLAGRETARMNAFADGILVAEKPFGHRLTEDGNARGFERIAVADSTAAQQRNPHCVEILCRDALKTTTRIIFFKSGLAAFDGDGHARLVAGRGDRMHAGLILQPIDQFADGHLRARPGCSEPGGKPRHRKVELRGEQVFRLEPPIYAGHLREAAQHQAYRHQQDQRESDFDDDQETAQTAALQTTGRTSADIFQRGIQIRFCRLPGGREPKQQAGQASDQQGEAHRPAVQSRLVQTRHVIGVEGNQHLQAQTRQQHPQHSTHQCEQQAFRQ